MFIDATSIGSVEIVQAQGRALNEMTEPSERARELARRKPPDFGRLG